MLKFQNCPSWTHGARKAFVRTYEGRKCPGDREELTQAPTLQKREVAAKMHSLNAMCRVDATWSTLRVQS
jgi:hypothetical protein